MTRDARGVEPRFLSLIVVPDDGRESRTFRIPYRTLRLGVVSLAAAGVVLALLAGSWWYLAARAVRTSELEREVVSLRRDRQRVAVFAARIDELEREYAKIRDLFGTDAGAASDLWLPPPAPRSRGTRPDPDPEGSRPSSWPLTQRGFVTQGLVEGESGDHPGLDIAVPTGSYVRAAGPGVVVEVGEDPVYGRFVTLDHGDGYRTLYGHASATLVELGQRVRRNEVIALSGSTGRSTAPHLHFEIQRNGSTIDPLSMVTQPS